MKEREDKYEKKMKKSEEFHKGIINFVKVQYKEQNEKSKQIIGLMQKNMKIKNQMLEKAKKRKKKDTATKRKLYISSKKSEQSLEYKKKVDEKVSKVENRAILAGLGVGAAALVGGPIGVGLLGVAAIPGALAIDKALDKVDDNRKTNLQLFEQSKKLYYSSSSDNDINLSK